MRIAVPLQGQDFSPHFGQSTAFALYEASPDTGVATRLDIEAPPHEHGVFAALLADRAADVVLAGGMGGGARNACAQAGIDVVVGVAPDAPDALVAAYLAGTLTTSENACEGHGCSH